MRITQSILNCLFLLFSSLLHGQFCGTELRNYPEDLLEEIAIYNESNKNEKNEFIDSIGITVHFIETIQGNSNIDIESLSSEIDQINQLFKSANIFFFICGAERYIIGNDSYDFNSGDELNRSYHVGNTINIYYADNVVDFANNQLCGYARFPWIGAPFQRYIMMSKSCQDNGSTLAHELGHYFGLLHTHESALGVELVDGSNCSTTGDLLCDTPADPGLGPGNMNGCSYIGREIDSNGSFFVPRTDNIMSYALSQCRRRFTQEQSDLIRFFYETEYSKFFRICDFYPDLSVKLNESSTTIKSGENIPIIVDVQVIGLQESLDVPVNFYLSDNELSRGQLLKTNVYFINQSMFSLTEEIIIEFPLNRNTGRYYLSAIIDPDKQIYEQSELNNQEKIVINVDNSSFNDAVLYPNPVINKFRIFMRDSRLKGDIDVNIWNQLGQSMQSSNSFKKGDEYFIELDVSGLNSGLYFCQLYFKDKKSVQSFTFFKQ